jgi:hypothetical protein
VLQAGAEGALDDELAVVNEHLRELQSQLAALHESRTLDPFSLYMYVGCRQALLCVETRAPRIRRPALVLVLLYSLTPR